jgi:hypothetical protein
LEDAQQLNRHSKYCERDNSNTLSFGLKELQRIILGLCILLFTVLYLSVHFKVLSTGDVVEHIIKALVSGIVTLLGVWMSKTIKIEK